MTKIPISDVACVHSSFKSNLLLPEKAQNTESIFDQDQLGGGSIKYDWEHGDAEHQYGEEPSALIDRTRAPRWP